MAPLIVQNVYYSAGEYYIPGFLFLCDKMRQHLLFLLRLRDKKANKMAGNGQPRRWRNDMNMNYVYGGMDNLEDFMVGKVIASGLIPEEFTALGIRQGKGKPEPALHMMRPALPAARRTDGEPRKLRKHRRRWQRLAVFAWLFGY